MQISRYINIHSHHKPLHPNELVIRNAYLNIVKNSAPNYLFSVGVHPWFVSKYNWVQTEKSLRALLAEPTVCAMGEIGLDKLKPMWDQQLFFFEKQIELAKEYNKPVIVHCVKAYPELIPFIKATNVPIILHGYHGNRVQTEKLATCKNVYFSFGPKQITTLNKGNILQWISPDKVFVETDTIRKSVEKVYIDLLPYVQLTLKELQLQIMENFKQVFER